MINKRILKECFIFTGFRWYKNIKFIPNYFSRVSFLIKNEYDKYSAWNINLWFISTMKDILKYYKETQVSYPIIIENYPLYDFNNPKKGQALRDSNDKQWDEIIMFMIDLLDDMDMFNPKYLEDDCARSSQVQLEAKDKFFELFSKYFYHLWD